MNWKRTPRRKAALYYPSQVKLRPVRLRKRTDPYDGLRPWSAITHGISRSNPAPCCLLRCAALPQPPSVVSLSMVSMVGLRYGQHSTTLQRHVMATALRKYDHASIYFLIAGTYTPSAWYLHRRCLGLGPVWRHLGLGPGRAGAHPGLDHCPPLAHRRHLSSWLLGCGGPRPRCCLLPLPAFFCAGRHSLHRGRRATPSSGLAAIIPALAVMRFFTCSSYGLGVSTSCSCTGWSRFSEHKLSPPWRKSRTVIPLLEAPALPGSGPMVPTQRLILGAHVMELFPHSRS